MALDNRVEIPALQDCKPGIAPTSFCVLVAIAEQQEQTKGGILLPDAMRDKQGVVEQRGRLVAISPVAFDFANFSGKESKVGDAVIIAKLAGVAVDGADGRKYRLCLDKDILAVVEESNG